MMKYVAIIDDSLLSNFRVDKSVIGIKPLVMVVNDEKGCGRGIELNPLVKEMIVTTDGISAYLSHEHIDCLLEMEKRKALNDMISSFEKVQ